MLFYIEKYTQLLIRTKDDVGAIHEEEFFICLWDRYLRHRMSDLLLFLSLCALNSAFLNGKYRGRSSDQFKKKRGRYNQDLNELYKSPNITISFFKINKGCTHKASG